jgi:predicted DNA-binding protein
MPTEKGDKKSLTVWIEKELVTKLDALAEKGEITRSKLVTNIVSTQIYEVKKYQKLGFVYIATAIRYIREKVSKKKTSVKADDKRALTFWVAKKIVQEIDNISGEVGLTRSRLVRNMIAVSVEELEALNKIHLLSQSALMKDMGKQMEKQYKREFKKAKLSI